ncbi:hypothetical protein CDD82_7139 [Ophiocordyceps australis]|uniref:Telomeric single stranded DNA binding POT1/Cdc13 domain-containing protein n=1 Tax=Ophiocordyceps australis TaxID=1399860 RepID=A0A2C5YVB6_9HYPO|nr:hypothetical protein CDD82_7139 [Ophiocordyceps australis]
MSQKAAAVEVLDSSLPTPIAQLHPEIDEAASRVLHGVITITWPYSILTKSLAFILAERDFRLRSQTGQLRLELHGAAAKALADLGVGAGDEMRISLSGATWEEPQAKIRLPQGALKWQLKYSNRLLLKLLKVDTQENNVLQIDASEEEQDSSAPLNAHVDIALPPSPREPDSQQEQTTPRVTLAGSKRLASTSFEQDELASPAFLKRARVSYGSLFEGGIDSFDDNTEAKRRNRRRSRFSLGSTTWRYSSKSLSPEQSLELDEESDPGVEQPPKTDERAAVPAKADSSTKPLMVDDGCQTYEMELSPAVNASISVDSPLSASMTWQTPSRTLFGPGSDHQAASRLRNEQTGTYTALPFERLIDAKPNRFASPHTFDSRSAQQTTADAMQSFRNPVASQTTSGGDACSAQTLHIDPHLHLQDIHESNHPYYNMPQDERMEWQGSSAAPVYPQMRFQDASQQPIDAASNHPLILDHRVNVESIPRDSAASGTDGLTPTKQDRQMLEEDEYVEPENPEEVDQEISDEHSLDGGEIPGEDYDLRNYDRARDDDGDLESDDEPVSDDKDVDDAIIDFSDEDQDTHEDSQDFEAEESDYDDLDDAGEEEDARNKAYHQNALHGDYGIGASEADDSDENGEDHDESAEDGGFCYDSQYEYTPPPSAPKEQVFIDLISDDEEDDGDQAAELPPRQPTPQTRDSHQPLTIEANAHTTLSASEHQDDMGHVEVSAETGRNDDAQSIDTEERFISELEGSDGEPTSGIESQIGHSEAEPSTEVKDERIAPDFAIVEKAKNEGFCADVAKNGDFGNSEDLQADLGGVKIAADSNDARLSEETNVSITSDVAKDGLSPVTEQPASAQPLDADYEAVGQSGRGITGSHTPLRGGSQVLAPQGSLGVESAEAMQTDDDSDHDAESIEEDDGLFEADPSDTLMEDSADKRDSSVLGPNDEFDGNHDIMELDNSVPLYEQATPADQQQEQILAEGKDKEQRLVEAAHEVDVVQSGERSEELRETFNFQEAQKHATPQDNELEGSGAGPAAVGLLEPAQDVVASTSPESVFAQETEQESDVSEKGTLAKDTIVGSDSQARATGQEDEDNMTAEAQIMAEFIGSQSACNSVDKDSSKSGNKPWATEQDGGETCSTVESRRHYKHDPSISLAMGSKAAVPEQVEADKVAVSSELMVVAAKKGGAKDPSILLAKLHGAGGNLTEGTPSKKNSPSISSLSRQDDGHDPSVQLAMESEAASPGQTEAVKESIPPQGAPMTGRRRWSNDPSILLVKADGAESNVGENTPMTPRVTRSMASQADAAMTSPSIAGSMSDSEEVAMLQKELQAIHQTDLADFVLLRSLRSRHLLKKTVDVMAVCTHTPPQPHRPKHGPRDYMLELVLTDFSSTLAISVAHIFRPHMASLPVAHVGDVILLRQMEVISLKGRGHGLKDKEMSAWAVFEKDDKEMLPQIKGPPVEVTQAEVDYAQLLRRRWTMQDDRARARVDQATRKAIEAGKDDSK